MWRAEITPLHSSLGNKLRLKKKKKKEEEEEKEESKQTANQEWDYEIHRGADFSGIDLAEVELLISVEGAYPWRHGGLWSAVKVVFC